jgi:hypothetical protein
MGRDSRSRSTASSSSQSVWDASALAALRRYLRSHLLLSLTAVLILAATALTIVLSPSPGDTFAVILAVPMVFLIVAVLLYVFVVDGWLAERTKKLCLLGQNGGSVGVIRIWMRRHRLIAFTCILTPVLLTAIAALAVNRAFEPVKVIGPSYLALVLSTAVHWSFMRGLNAQRLIRYGSRATGTIIGRREDHGVTGGSRDSGPDSFDAYWVTYSFMPREGVEFHEERKVDQRMWDKLRVGSRVVIAFDPEDPLESLLLGRPEDNPKAKYS